MITCEGTLSYVHVFEPTVTPSDTLKYSCAFLIPKDNEQGLKEIREAIQQAVAKGVEINKYPRTAVPGLRLPLRDGDKEVAEGSRGKEFEGHFFFNCSSVNPPGVVGPDAKPLMDNGELYSGCVGRLDVNFFPYNAKGNKGVGVGLNNVMKVRDGDRLDGRQDAESAFGDYAQAATESAQTPSDDVPY